MGGKKRFSKSSKTQISKKRSVSRFSRFSDITSRKETPVFMVAIFVFSAIFVFALGIYASNMLTSNTMLVGHAVSDSNPLSTSGPGTSDTSDTSDTNVPTSPSGTGTSTTNLFTRIWNLFFGSGQPKAGLDNICTCNSCENCTAQLNDPNCDVVQLLRDIAHTGHEDCIGHPDSAYFNNKVFDCQSRLINYTGDYYRLYGIYLFGSGNTIKNCSINNFAEGIHFQSSSSNSSNSLMNNKVCSNRWDIVSYDSNFTSGLNNSCDMAYNFNDTGYIGCSKYCNGTQGRRQNQTTCTDSDGGLNYNVKGTCNDGVNHFDNCGDTIPSKVLTEYKCSEPMDSGEKCVSILHTCPGTCVNGACVQQQTNCSCNSCSDCTNKLNDPNCNIVKLTNYVSNTGTCINNPANFNNKTFDCQGNFIDGGYAGISLNDKTGNTIKNCKIVNIFYGIVLMNSTNNTLININLSTNVEGIYLSYSSKNILMNILTNYNQVHGILLSYSTNNTLTNINSSSNKDGIFTANSNNNILLQNIACKNSELDILNDGTNNFGTNNICDKTSNFNDTGYIGCTWYCNGSQGRRQTTLWCIDTDGNNTNIKGTCTDYTGANITDYCSGTNVNELNCDNLKKCVSYVFACSYGCLNGACQTQHNNPTPVCGNGVKEIGEECDDLDGVPENCRTGYSGSYWCDDVCELQNDCTRDGGGGCTESWSCGTWSECIDGLQTRICTDAHSCGTTAYRPPLSQNCNPALPPCIESDWQCDSWSPCIDNQQSRNCVPTKNCDAYLGVSKNTIQSCTSQNHGQNQGNEENNLNTILIIAGSVLFLAIIVCVILILLRKNSANFEAKVNLFH